MKKFWLCLGVVLTLTGCADKSAVKGDPAFDVLRIPCDDENDFSLNRVTGEVTYAGGSFIIENKSWLDKLLEAYQWNVAGNSDCLYTFCNILNEIGSDNPDNVVCTKDEDDWCYDTGDKNNDGVLTTEEHIDYALDILVDKLKNRKPVETVTFEYVDDIIGGTGNYKYTLNPWGNEIKYSVVHVSSAVDAENTPEEGVKKVKNGIWVYNLCLLYNQGVLDSDWAYTYCRTIEDLCTKKLSAVLVKKNKANKSDWDNLYGGDDSNGDGVVTYKENIDHNIQMMLDDMVL